MSARLAAALTVAALGVAPVSGAPVSGLYAGIIAGAVAPGSSDVTLGGRLAGFETDDAAPLHPDSTAIYGPPFDPDLLDFLNDALAGIAHPVVGIGLDLALAATLEHRAGFAGGAVLGYGFGNGVRVEAEFSATGLAATSARLTGGHGTLAFGGYDGDDDIWQWAGVSSDELPPDLDLLLPDIGVRDATDLQFFLASAWYDFDTGARLVPYLGGGLGFARVSTATTDLCGCGPELLSASAIVPAAQLGAGLRLAMGAPATLDLGYRLRVATGGPTASLHESDPDSGLAAMELSVGQNGPILVHALQVGLSFALK